MTSLFLGILVIIFGIAIDKFHIYSLIAGLNTEEMRKKSKYNIIELSKAVSKLLYVIGIALILEELLANNLQNYSIFSFGLNILKIGAILYFVYEIRKEKYLK